MLWLATIRRLFFVLSIMVRRLLAFALTEAKRRIRWLAPLIRVRPLSGPESLRLALEQMGGTYIKFGQMLALQPDILPLAYCNALFNLLDRVAPFSVDDVIRTFVEETGRSPFDIFDRFDPVPLATASIGQVHVAMLQDRKLAVKVQRPRVDDDFGGDIRFMTAAVSLIRRIHLRPLYWIIEPMSEFVEWTREELDYRYEARYMEQLRRNCRDNPAERVPEVLWTYTSRRTLVSEFFEGFTVLACMRALESNNRPVIDQLDRQDFDSHQFASRIIDNFLGDVFEHGMFHADLHPANLMVLPGNVVGYIDFGITGVISLYSRRNLIGLTLAYTRGDLEGMCESFFRVSSLGPASDLSGFRRGLREAATAWYEFEGGARRLRKNFTLVMLDMLRLSRRTQIWPERDVIKYIRSAIAIDGLITRLAPTFDLGAYLESVCENHLRWHQRRAMFTLDRLTGWVSSSANLMRDGGVRATEWLGSAAARPGDRLSTARNAPPPRPRLSKTVFFAAYFFIVCLAISLSPRETHFGLNPFTAELFIAATAFLMLVTSIWKLSKDA